MAMLQQGAFLELVSEVYVGLVQSWSGYAYIQSCFCMGSVYQFWSHVMHSVSQHC